MAGYKEFYKNGSKVRYFPDNKTLVLIPNLKNKDAFLKLKSQLDTLLQITGTKMDKGTFSLKLDDTFNVNVDEVLKSLGMRGGIEKEDAASMVDDAAKSELKDSEKLQAPQGGAQPQTPIGAPPAPGQEPQNEGINLSVMSFLFEDFLPGRLSKRYGEYWKPIEAFSGKNRNAIKPEDILDARKKFSLKPPSSDRDNMLLSLDKAASYFYKRLEDTKGEFAADEFDQKYVEIDAIRPDDYKIDDNQNSDTMPSMISLTPDFEDVSYSDIDIER